MSRVKQLENETCLFFHFVFLIAIYSPSNRMDSESVPQCLLIVSYFLVFCILFPSYQTGDRVNVLFTY